MSRLPSHSQHEPNVDDNDSDRDDPIAFDSHDVYDADPLSNGSPSAYAAQALLYQDNLS